MIYFDMNPNRSFWITQFPVNCFFILFLLSGPLQLSVANHSPHTETKNASIQAEFLNITQTNTTSSTLPTSLLNSSTTSLAIPTSNYNSSDGYDVNRPYPPKCSGSHPDDSLCSFEEDDATGDNNDDNNDDNGDGDDNNNDGSTNNVSNCTNTTTIPFGCPSSTNLTTTIPSRTPFPGYESIPPNPYSASVSFSLVAGVITASLLVGSCILCACRLAARDRRQAMQRLRSRRQGSDANGLWSEDDSRSTASIMTEPLPLYVAPSSDEELRPPPKYENVLSHDPSEGSGSNEA